MGGSRMAKDSPSKKRGRAQRAKAILAAAKSGGLDADVEVDRRTKSRQKQFAAAAEEAGRAGRVTDHTLDIMDQTPRVVEMASATMEPDWGDNPAHLDTTEEVKGALVEAGLDPMDIDTPGQATFGHSLVHAYANDRDLGGRTPEQLEAEHDMVVEAMREYGFDHDSPLDKPDITGGGGGAMLVVDTVPIFGGDDE